LQVSRQRLREIIAKDMQTELNGHYFDIVAEEVRPYFRQVILEERRQIRNQLLYMHRKGTISDLIAEQILLENEEDETDEKPTEEEEESWYVGLAKDVGLGIGQMMGGGIGIAAGIAGITRYMPMFRKNIDKGFLSWIGPFISLFFSVTAVIYPAPGAKSLGEVLRGMFKGIKDIITGTASIFAKGVSKVFSKGAEYFGKAISLVGKLIKGVGSGIQGGGELVAKIGNAIGGGNVLKSLFGQLSKAATELSKRLESLANMLKAAKEIRQNGGSIKDVATAAFDSPVGSLSQRVKDLIQGSKAVKAVMKAKTAAGEAIEDALIAVNYLKAPKEVANISLAGFKTGAGDDLAKYSIDGINNGRIYASYIKDGKIVNAMIGGDDAARLMKQFPAIKNFAMSGLSDDAAKAFTKALPAATSTTRAAGKAVVDTLRNIPSRILNGSKTGLNRFKNQFLVKAGETFPSLFSRMIGKSIPAKNLPGELGTVASTLKMNSIDDAGNIAFSIFDDTGALIANGEEPVNVFLTMYRTGDEASAIMSEFTKVAGRQGAEFMARLVAATSKAMGEEQ
jgi:hypothetical protein